MSTQGNGMGRENFNNFIRCIELVKTTPVRVKIKMHALISLLGPDKVHKKVNFFNWKMLITWEKQSKWEQPHAQIIL
jgi:hypothetical protein